MGYGEGALLHPLDLRRIANHERLPGLLIHAGGSAARRVQDAKQVRLRRRIGFEAPRGLPFRESVEKSGGVRPARLSAAAGPAPHSG